MPIINNPPHAQPLIENSGRSRVAWAEWFMQVFRICFSVQQSGTTADRPTKDLWVGRTYFDTTLNRPIWYTGTNWIRADGVVV